MPENLTPEPPARHTTSRRATIVGTAWAVPAIVAISAAPAYASSGAGTLTFVPGTTSYGNAGLEAITFGNASVLVSGGIIEPTAPLTMTISYLGIPARHSQNSTPTGFTYVNSGPGASQVFTYNSQIDASVSPVGIPLTDGLRTFASPAGTAGFVLTFSAPGFTTSSTPYGPPPR